MPSAHRCHPDEDLDQAGVGNHRRAARDRNGAAVDQDSPGGIATGSSRVVECVARHGQDARGRCKGSGNGEFAYDLDRTMIADAGVAALIIDGRFGTAGVAIPSGLHQLDLCSLKNAFVPELTNSLPAVSVDAPAVILYTSGSTGRPKGIVNSQKNLLQRTMSVRQLLPHRQRRRSPSVELILHHRRNPSTLDLATRRIAPLHCRSEEKRS